MNEFWEGLVLLLFGAAAGGLAGYHAGLKRAAEAIWEGAKAEAESMSSLPPSPAREAIIKECIETVLAVRPAKGDANAMSMEEMNQQMWVRLGVDEAIDALQMMDKRGAGRYGIPRNIMDLRSRIALEKGEG